MLQTPNGILTYLEDRVFVTEDLASLAKRFRTAEPFSHLVFEGLFSDALLQQVVDEIPQLPSEAWVDHDDERLTKRNLRSAVHLGRAGTELLCLVHSAAFLYMLSEITGIQGLLPDPYLGGSGYHIVPRGGKFDVHLDRNTEFHSGLFRRLAMLIYLNENWNPAYGGQLEMWNAEGNQCQKAVEPKFNRTLLFEINDHAYHGVRPVTCPRGSARQSFAVYYHTVSPDVIVPHNSTFMPSCYAKKESTLHRVLRMFTPPILMDGIRALRR